MKEYEKILIEAVVHNDIIKAKKAATIILESNTSKKDERFCKQTLLKLQNSPMIMQLPANISSFATMEDVSQTFINNRYFLSNHEKQLYMEIVNSDKVGEILSEKRIRYLNATLLYGESGTGKTTFGRYLAYKLGIPFLYLNFSCLISSLLGKTGQNIQQVFDYAKQQRCVFMLDELDAIGAERSQKNNDVSEISRIVITLIQSLDLLENDVILLAATNRYDIIDNAIKRRFSRHHEIKKLCQNERTQFAKTYLIDCGYNVSDDDILNIIGKSEKQSDIENMLINYIINQEIKKYENGDL